LPDVPHLVANGGSIFSPGESVTVTCERGYTVNTPSTICQSDKTWNPIPACTIVTCNVPPFAGGYYLLNEIAIPSSLAIPFESTIVPKCLSSEQVPSPGTHLTCNLDGQLTGQRSICIDITCSTLPNSFENGTYDVRGNSPPFQYNQTVTPVCNKGFNLHQGGPRYCSGVNKWSGIEPLCNPIVCNSPKNFTNGQYDLIQNTYSYGSVLEPKCNTGYRMTNNVTRRVCNESNTWSGPEPECQIVKCIEPLVINGSLSTQDNVYTYNTSVTFQCIEGFEIKDGQYTRTCQDDGTWGTHTIVCVKTRCNDNSEIKQAFILSYPEELDFGDVRNVSYNSTYFYLQQGSIEVTCSSNRKLAWTKSPVFGKIST